MKSKTRQQSLSSDFWGKSIKYEICLMVNWYHYAHCQIKLQELMSFHNNTRKKLRISNLRKKRKSRGIYGEGSSKYWAKSNLQTMDNNKAKKKMKEMRFKRAECFSILLWRGKVKRWWAKFVVFRTPCLVFFLFLRSPSAPFSIKLFNTKILRFRKLLCRISHYCLPSPMDMILHQLTVRSFSCLRSSCGNDQRVNAIISGKVICFEQKSHSQAACQLIWHLLRLVGDLVMWLETPS